MLLPMDKSFCSMAGLVVVFLCYLLLEYNAVHGYNSFYKEDDLKFEKQNEHINKPYVKTIKTDYGEVYDCVDFYKQPAFDHPLLKNLTSNFQPQFTERKNREVSSDYTKYFNIGLKDGGCPTGYVPIKRIKRNDMIRVERVAERLDASGIHYAVVQAQNNKFTGATGYLSVYSPLTEGQEYSAGRMKIQNGINGNEFIAFGWRRDPTHYGDSLSHFYIQTSTDAYKCLDCGFVLVAKDVAPGMSFPEASIPGQFYIQVLLSVARAKDGNWWLEIGEGRNATQVGYWPHYLFKDLSDFGTFVDWGGEVYSPDTYTPSMGSGEKPTKANVDYDAFVARISVLDINGNPFDPDTVMFADYKDGDHGYDVLDVKNYGDDYKHTVLYGGPGLSKGLNRL